MDLKAVQTNLVRQRRSELARLRNSIVPFTDADVERHGNRVFVDKLVQQRLALKRGQK